MRVGMAVAGDYGRETVGKSILLVEALLPLHYISTGNKENTIALYQIPGW